jgi:uncharacterized protein YjbJ (UPF0337 family)
MAAETDTAAEFVPASLSLAKPRRGAEECREDIEGEPFVGPAGGVLARVLENAGEVEVCRPWLEAELKAVKPLQSMGDRSFPVRRPAFGVPGARTQRERLSSDMGILDKITGRAKKAAGDLADDPSLRRQGKREERKGEKEEELDRAQEKADEKAEEVADLERKT